MKPHLAGTIGGPIATTSVGPPSHHEKDFGRSQAMLAVVGIYAGVQFAESYLVTPLIQKRTVSMPPALLITSPVVLGVLAGTIGVAVATPLVVMVVILVQMLYLQDVLGDDVTVMGNGDTEAAA